MAQLLFCCILVLSCQLLTFGSEEISSKLDFNEDASAKSDEVIQVAKGRIPGVRVTVDTIKLNPIGSYSNTITINYKYIERLISRVN